MSTFDVQSMMEEAIASDEHRFGSFFLSRLFGMSIEYREDECIVSFQVRRELSNPMGYLHGGVLATGIDISMGHLLFYSSGAPGVTVELKIQYLAPVKAGTVVCSARYIQRGKSISFLQSEVRSSVDPRMIAVATATWKSTIAK
jgi:uncharacterized protein (TIGR00369 family)